jgi:hypothetical protein
MLDPQELRAIDDFRFKLRLPTRAAAVRELLKRGLLSSSGGEVLDGSLSRDFGVLGTFNDSGFRGGDVGDGADR